nr:putative oxidoreductase [Quercus suber]
MPVSSRAGRGNDKVGHSFPKSFGLEVSTARVLAMKLATMSGWSRARDRRVAYGTCVLVNKILESSLSHVLELPGALRCGLAGMASSFPAEKHRSIGLGTFYMASYFITGASRGFGLALVNELLSRPVFEVAKIVASVRESSFPLDKLANECPDRMAVVKLDVTDEESVKAAAREVEILLPGKGLDVLINNAGVAQYVSDGVRSM